MTDRSLPYRLDRLRREYRALASPFTAVVRRAGVSPSYVHKVLRDSDPASNPTPETLTRIEAALEDCRRDGVRGLSHEERGARGGSARGAVKSRTAQLFVTAKCKAPGCNRRGAEKGFCKAHRERQRRGTFEGDIYSPLRSAT